VSDFTTKKRARLGPTRAAMTDVLGNNDCGNLLQPLWPTKGMVWPYTPNVTFGGQANYSSYHFTHSNYQFHNFQNSAPEFLQVAGTFTAQTNEEARYMVAMMRFLRGATMMEFGIPAAQRGLAGTPPPVLRFNYLGAHMFNNIPVVVNNFNFTLEDSVDYTEVQLPTTNGLGLGGLASSFNDFIFGDSITPEGNRTWVPTRMMLVVSLLVQQNTRNVRENFDLADFKRGALINKGFV